MFVITLAGLLGHPGRRGSNIQVPFLDGQLRRPAKRSQPRLITLSVEVMDRDEFGTVPSTRGEQWEDNMDLLMALVDGEGETAILERDMADGTTRWMEGEVISPFQFVDGMRTAQHVSYIGAVTLECHHPYFQSEQQFTKTLGGAFIPPGNATLFNQTLSFASAGTVHHHESGDDITVNAGTFPVLVDCGKREVTVGGVDASNRVTLNSASWMRFPSGITQTFTSSASGSMLYRSQHF